MDLGKNDNKVFVKTEPQQKNHPLFTLEKFYSWGKTLSPVKPKGFMPVC